MTFDQFLFSVALVVSAIVSLLMLTFARSFRGFLGMLLVSLANFALMLFLSVYFAAYCGFAYSIASLIAGTLVEETIADKCESKER